MDIIINPGAKNSTNGTPFISGLRLPKASVKIAINNIVVAIGAAIVCRKILKNLCTSFL
jgi:hypothetical protein